MCLRTEKWRRPTVAKEDITVYKVLYITPSIDYNNFAFPLKIKAPFSDFEIPSFGHVLHAEGDPKKKKTDNEAIDEGYVFYGEGWFHTYTDFETAKKVIGMMPTSYPNICIECIIPKGTKYMKGTCKVIGLGEVPSIASRELKYTNKVHKLRSCEWCFYMYMTYEGELRATLYNTNNKLVRYLKKHFNLEFVEEENK